MRKAQRSNLKGTIDIHAQKYIPILPEDLQVEWAYIYPAMKPMTTYTVNERTYTASEQLSQDLNFESTLPYVFDLDYLGALDVSGNTDAAFLQGQLTCDVNEVSATQMRPGGMCSLQGRLLALLDVVAWQGLHLVMPKDLLATSQQSLAKTALFSRVTLHSHTQFAFLGLYLPQHAYQPNLPCALPTAPWQVSQTTDFCCYALSEHLFIIILRDASQKSSWLAAFPNQQQRGSLAWHYLELQLPRLSIYPNTRGLFLPHRLHLHTTPYISFNKGCYKGQEIIARTHYRAKLKHSLKLCNITTKDPIFAGQKCYAAPEQAEIGEIIDYCPIDADQYLIAISILSEHPEQVYFEQHQASTRIF